MELPNWELADGWPRRMAASSMTSSWKSVARWVSSMATAAGTMRLSRLSPKRAASSTSMARKRLPPAAIMCRETSANISSPPKEVSRRAASTAARSSAISAVRVASAKSTGTAMITRTPCRRRIYPSVRTHQHTRLSNRGLGQPLAWGSPDQVAPGFRTHRTEPLRSPRSAMAVPALGERGDGHWQKRLMGALADEQLRRRVVSERQHRLREDAEDDGRERTDADRDAGEGRRHGHHRAVRHRLAEEHQHDHPGVEERRDRGGDHTDDDQRQVAARDRRLEDGELPDEPGRERDAGEREQEQREDAGHHRRALAESGPAGQVVRLAALVADQGDNRERADRAQAVRGEVEQRRG